MQAASTSFEDDARFPTLPWTGWTMQWYPNLLTDGRLLQSLQRSLIVSPLAAAKGIGFFAAYVLNRFDFPGKNLLSALFIVPILVLPLILGVTFLGLLPRLNRQGQFFSVFLIHIAC